MTVRIDLTNGDITGLAVDAIVNAANSTLMGGGGVDGAIHRAAGPGLAEECLLLNGCRTGEAKITGGHNLRARHVIHTVGPVWHGGGQNEEELLASCYRSCLDLAGEYRVGEIAFPAISTGAYRFPRELAARIAVREALRFLQQHELPRKIIFVCFDRTTLDVYRQAQAAVQER